MLEKIFDICVEILRVVFVIWGIIFLIEIMTYFGFETYKSINSYINDKINTPYRVEIVQEEK